MAFLLNQLNTTCIHSPKNVPKLVETRWHRSVEVCDPAEKRKGVDTKKKKVVTDSPVCRRASRSKGIGFSLVGGEKCSRKTGTQDLVCPWRASAWAFRLQNSPWMKSVKVFLISNWNVKSENICVVLFFLNILFKTPLWMPHVVL